MGVYVEKPTQPALAPRAFRLSAGHWETATLADYRANGCRARWYGFTASPPRDILSAAYQDLIGYCPFADCPDIAPETVADTLAEYCKAMT